MGRLRKHYAVTPIRLYVKGLKGRSTQRSITPGITPEILLSSRLLLPSVKHRVVWDNDYDWVEWRHFVADPEVNEVERDLGGSPRVWAGPGPYKQFEVLFPRLKTCRESSGSSLRCSYIRPESHTNTSRWTRRRRSYDTRREILAGGTPEDQDRSRHLCRNVSVQLVEGCWHTRTLFINGGYI